MPILQSTSVKLRSRTMVELFDSGPEPVLHLLAAINSAILVEVLLYGIHCILFCVCAYIFLSRRLVKPFIIGSAIIMFALSTADVAISLGLLVRGLRMPFMDESHLLTCRYPKNPIFVANNLIADMLLFHRCYAVWGRQIFTAVVAGVFLLVVSIWGWAGAEARLFFIRATFSSIYLWMVFSLNIIVTAATAGRIFWVSRIAGSILRPGHIRRYNTIISILVESAVVYSTCIFIYLIFSKHSSSLYKLVFASIVMRIVAIMPTLMIVRVGLGKGLDDEGRDGVDAREQQAQPTSVVFDSIISVQSSREADKGNSPSRDSDTSPLEETSGNVDVFPMVAVQSISRL